MKYIPILVLCFLLHALIAHAHKGDYEEDSSMSYDDEEVEMSSSTTVCNSIPYDMNIYNCLDGMNLPCDSRNSVRDTLT